jgi:hypothetical protein
MRDVYAAAAIKDRGGRRSGIDRRRSWPLAHYPERRSRGDRRGGLERRRGKDDFLNLVVPRRGTDAFIEFFGTVRGLFWGISLGSVLWGIMIILIAFIHAR